jgi:hypothetical protein
MPPVPAPKKPTKSNESSVGTSTSKTAWEPSSGAALATPIPSLSSEPGSSGDVGIAVSGQAGSSGVVTARRAGGLRDMAMDVDPKKVGVKAALQHLAKAVNIAFQTDYGENYLESVYQAAIVRKSEMHIVHKEYFGFGDSWFGQLGMLLKSMQLTFQGPDPASPEGQQRIAEHGSSTIRGLLNFLGRKLDLVAEFEDRVPAYVEQMFDRLEASGIIVGWDREDWDVTTTRIGLSIRISPKKSE